MTSLRAVGYDEEAVVERLGDDGPAAEADEVPVHARRLDDSPLATCLRLCLLQLPVEVDAARLALTAGGVDALLALGLAELDGALLRPRARIVPVEGLLMAFDGFARGADDPVGFVAPYTPTASWLAALTPRRRAGRALDVGTGNGIHALLAAAHCDHVIATDVNPRALAFTAINAALNDLGNVETRLGSLYDPVAGEQFDLITCNAPYVVSPESRWQYRDGGLPADELSHRVVEQAAAALADDGLASLLVSWVAESEDEPDERVVGWLAHARCDAWVLGLEGADPLAHAAGWNEHLAVDPQAYGAALDEWLAYFDQLGVGWISEGAVLLHRRGRRALHDPPRLGRGRRAGVRRRRRSSERSRPMRASPSSQAPMHFSTRRSVLAREVRIDRVAGAGAARARDRARARGGHARRVRARSRRGRGRRRAGRQADVAAGGRAGRPGVRARQA